MLLPRFRFCFTPPGFRSIICFEELASLPLLSLSTRLKTTAHYPSNSPHHSSPRIELFNLLSVTSMITVSESMCLFLIAVFAVTATAAPYLPKNAVMEMVHRRTPVATMPTTTRDAIVSVCTNGLPASKQHPAGYPINDYTVVTPATTNWTSYSVKKDWYQDHYVSGPHVCAVSETIGQFCVVAPEVKLTFIDRSSASRITASRTAHSSVSTHAMAPETATATLPGTVGHHLLRRFSSSI